MGDKNVDSQFLDLSVFNIIFNPFWGRSGPGGGLECFPAPLDGIPFFLARGCSRKSWKPKKVWGIISKPRVKRMILGGLDLRH